MMSEQADFSASGGWTMPEQFFNMEFDSVHPLNRERLASAEAALGIRFPDSYVHFLEVRNGGYIEFSTHPSLEPKRLGLRGSPVPVRGIAGVRNGSSCYDIEALTKNMQGWGVNTEDFVALDGEGHYWIAFDKRNLNPRGEPTIAYIASEDGNANSIASCTIADDFQSFVESLIPDADD